MEHLNVVDWMRECVKRLLHGIGLFFNLKTGAVFTAERYFRQALKSVAPEHHFTGHIPGSINKKNQ